MESMEWGVALISLTVLTCQMTFHVSFLFL